MGILFSIVMPVYQAESWLDRGIECVLSQTYTNWELIVINDGSTDRSDEIAKRYAEIDKRVHYDFHENQGVSKTRNRGIELAKGDYILFMDCDDKIEIDTLQTFFETIVKEQNIDILFGDYIEIEGENTKRVSSQIYTTERLFEVDYQDLIKEFYELHLLHNIGTKVYRKELIENIQFNENLSIYEDVIFTLEALKKSRRIGYIPKVVYYYINNNEHSLIHSYKKRMLEAHEELFKELSFFFPYDFDKKRDNQWINISYLLSINDILENEKKNTEKSDVCKKISNTICFRDYYVHINQLILFRLLGVKRWIKLLIVYFAPDLVQIYINSKRKPID